MTPFTENQKQILALVALGSTLKEIAYLHKKSIGAIKTTIRRMRLKTKTHNNAHLVFFAYVYSHESLIVPALIRKS